MVIVNCWCASDIINLFLTSNGKYLLLEKFLANGEYLLILSSSTCQYAAISLVSSKDVMQMEISSLSMVYECFRCNLKYLLMDKGIQRKLTWEFGEGFVIFIW